MECRDDVAGSGLLSMHKKSPFKFKCSEELKAHIGGLYYKVKYLILAINLL